MINRYISESLLDALADTPVVFLNGARQTGKSTLVQDIAAHGHPARYLTFDDGAVLAAAHTDPAGFLASFEEAEESIVLDEVQRVPDIFLALKAAIDRDRRPGRVLLTGSANILLLPHLAETLVGRMEVLTLWPFSQGELAEVRESFIDTVFAKSSLPTLPVTTEMWSALVERILRGGYPEALSRKTETRRGAWFGSYVTTLLQRDVRDLSNIESLTTFPRLLTLLATRTGALLNTSELSRGLGMPLSTLKRYLALLETMFLVQSLPAWSGNLGKRLVKAPKIVLNDTGLAAHLLGTNTAALKASRDIAGPLLENFVVMELRKQATWSQLQPQLFHFRTQTGQEVDIVLEDREGRLVGIEVKASKTVSSRDFKGLRVLAEAVGTRFQRGIVLYTGTESLPFGPNLYALPIQTLWADYEEETQGRETHTLSP